jgi:thiosulfate/3-mercaptopyruvate sulfurtransferase
VGEPSESASERTIRRSPLINATAVRTLLDGDEPPLVLDVRGALGVGDPVGDHDAAHIPGSRYVDLETELSGPHGPGLGRHPLPAPDAFAATATGWGVGPETAVVAYDDNGGMSAARLWWLLRWIGHEDVRVLDGGLGAWRSAGGAIEAGADPPATPSAAPLVARAGAMRTVSADEIVAGLDAVLVDARAAERFRGEIEPVDPVAGHIPGARNVPTAGNLAPDGTFLPPAELRARFEAVGIRAGGPPVVTYCGSGVTAAHALIALEIAGLAAGSAMYPPSWSGWVSDPARPVVTS